jgi:hypothetical protein
MPRQQELRIGLRDADGLRSPYWKIVVDRERDVYVAHETLTRHGVKLSLHESGRFHLAGGKDRDHLKWRRPEPQHPGFLHLLTIGLLAGGAVTTTVEAPAALYPPAPADHIRYFKLIFEHPAARLDTWPGKTADRSELVGRLRMLDDVRLCIVTNVEPFESVTQTVPGGGSLDDYVGHTEHGIMGVLFGSNPDGSRWLIEGPVEVTRNSAE